MYLGEALIKTGKARLPHYVNGVYVCLSTDKLRVLDHANREVFDVRQMISDQWESYESPCKHEPVRVRYIDDILNEIDGRFEKSKETAYEMKCKHCGAKIKAVGWEKV